ncbi:MAG: NAD(P)-dependent oxidoreductase [Marinovum sp.]|nr:NAD(P)-dependent oxidoreductase [Marinovum sp.]
MGTMTLLVTGASGFIGQAVVQKARRAGHAVIALVRSATSGLAEWALDEGIERMSCDLASPNAALLDALERADCVIHCAASMTGNTAAHAHDTNAATRALLEAMPESSKLVHLSTIAVFDFAALPDRATLNEASPLERAPEGRDAYAASKLAQEHTVYTMALAKDFDLTILRPGIVFGPGRLWHAHLGRIVGPFLLYAGQDGEMPVAHVSLTARAILAAAERPANDPILILDDDRPSVTTYLAGLRKKPLLRIALPPILWERLLTPQTAAARFKPLLFDNSRMNRVLGVTQEASFEELMREAQA